MDIYSCAARASEIHRYLVGHKASQDEVNACLSSDTVRDLVDEREGFYFLKGKDHLWARRVRFLEHSRKGWIRAREIADKIQRSGLATAGMVTGSLAAENCDEHADIDFLLIYPARRAWLSFGVVRLLGKVPKLGLRNMCPNYALPDDHLEIQPKNLFTAWEIAKAVPMFGMEVYQSFVEANAWVREFLPNALPTLDRPLSRKDAQTDPALVEKLIDSRPFQWLEDRERQRKWKRDERDVGVDLEKRYGEGSVDRHSPTRPFQTLCELRYRMDLFGLEKHPLYQKIDESSGSLRTEMDHWGDKKIPRPRSPQSPPDSADRNQESQHKNDRIISAGP